MKTPKRPVFRKAGKKMTSHLRHLAVDAGMSGTKSLLFRAGRYSIHQFFKSFAAMFAALLILPRALNKAFQSTLKTERHWGGFGSGIVSGMKGAFMGIPSLIRSGFAAVKVQLYGVAASIYHFLETIKAFFVVITGQFGQFNAFVHHAFSAMTVNVMASMRAIALMSSHFIHYIGSVFESFKSGTSHAVTTLWEKEKTWGIQMHGRLDYVSHSLSHVLTAISSALARIWECVTDFGGGFKHKVGDLAVTVGHRVHDTAANAGHKAKIVVVDVSHRMHDAALDISQVFHKVHDKALSVHEKAADVRHKVHDAAIHGLHSVGDAEHKVVVKIKTTAQSIRAKGSDLLTGVKVGTVQIFHKMKDGVPHVSEKAILVLKTSTDRSKHILQVGMAKGKVAAAQFKTTLSKGSQDLVWFFGSLGKQTHRMFSAVTRPFLYPVFYIANFPGRVVHTMHVTPVTVYLYLLSVCGLISYLGLSIKTRYDREMFARKLGISKKELKEVILPDAHLFYDSLDH